MNIHDIISREARKCGAEYCYKVRWKPAHYFTVEFAKLTPHGLRLVGTAVIPYSEHDWKEYNEAYFYYKKKAKGHRRAAKKGYRVLPL